MKPKGRLILDGNFETFKKEFKDAEKTNMGYRSSSGKIDVMCFSSPSCEEFPEFDSPELEKYFQTSGRSSNDLKILENAIRKQPILLGDRRIIKSILYYRGLLDGALKWRRKDNVHLWKGGYNSYRKFLNAVSRAIIPKDSQGRYKNTGENDNEVIKKEYKSLIKVLKKFFKENNVEIEKKDIPNNKSYYLIKNPNVLYTILSKLTVIDNKQLDSIKRIINYMYDANSRNKKLKRYQKIKSVESLAKHILAVRFNKSFYSIENILGNNIRKK